jgi:hypothetical protein
MLLVGEPIIIDLSTVYFVETVTATRGSKQDTRKNHLAAVPVSTQNAVRDSLFYF